ncbi:GntR family transcriptional regulator [Rhodococcus sp. TAF43]|jgi:DNA-binding GntR family transcriptional regulator|uniref:GntR family transcriptional regulator n=1 Tax=unclassified Rhodococcus (in: high G+C Gram-positive bacteria) TaxID=192944 RepID=UPI0015820307|nr:GntR family transcriptional regulator [Rhodococcus sp. W8901]QKT10144.1 GntR family transcriptional regulator [Rhodococcus sp. W8901]
MGTDQGKGKSEIRPIDEVRRAILDGEWRPGEKLPTAALAERFDTSTTVMREALTRLAGDDLVVAKLNRGFFVRDLSIRELSDITELRCATESVAVRISLERGGLQWESDLISAHHQMTRIPRRDGSDPAHINEEWAAAHRRFHQTIIGACECDPMIRLSANLADSTELYRRWAAPSTAATIRDVEREHREILDAALARDTARTAELVCAHYKATVQVVLDSGLADSVVSSASHG